MSCKQEKKRYSIVYAMTDRTPYAGNEWFRIGMDDRDYDTFKGAMRRIETSVDIQIRAKLGGSPKRSELIAEWRKVVERPTDSTVLFRSRNMTTLYKVCGREVA